MGGDLFQVFVAGKKPVGDALRWSYEDINSDALHYMIDASMNSQNPIILSLSLQR